MTETGHAENSQLWSLNKKQPLEGPELQIHSSAATSRQNSHFALHQADTRVTVCTRGKNCWANTSFSFICSMDISGLSCSNTLSPSPLCIPHKCIFINQGFQRLTFCHHQLFSLFPMGSEDQKCVIAALAGVAQWAM